MNVIDQARAEYLEHQRHEDRFRRAREREQLPEALEKANRILGLDLTLEQVQIEGPYIYFERWLASRDVVYDGPE